MSITVSVFGTARSKAGDELYEEARELGYRLAQEGYEVSSGGFAGAMEAVSRGAREAGGKVKGVTFRALAEKASPNEWLDEVIEEADLFSRIKRLTTADALIAVSGGIGTLAEVSIAWNLLQTDGMEAKPLILMGKRWEALVSEMRKQLIIDDGDIEWIQLLPTVEDTVRYVNEHFSKQSELK